MAAWWAGPVLHSGIDPGVSSPYTAPRPAARRSCLQAGPMPRAASPLPSALAGSVFTCAEARSAGVGSERLRSTAVRRVTQGAYRAVADVPGTWADLGLGEPVAGLPPEEAAVVVAATRGVASHVTALRLHGMVLPPWLAEDRRLHVSRPHGRGRSGRAGVVTHARDVPAADVTEVHGIRVTTPERAWVDLSSLLRPGQIKPAVVAGDALVRHPWVDGVRMAPLTTPQRLREALKRAGRFKGVRAARAALELVRVGADSPPETELRLALLDAGLPEPRLQVRLVTSAGEQTDADLAIDEARVVLHYDGGHHRTPDQQARDARRDRLWQEAGRLSLSVSVLDRRDGYRGVVRTVLRRWAQVRADVV